MSRAASSCDRSAVLVVVDLQQLEPDADPTAACAALDGRADGIDALEAAGFDVTGSARFGRSFTCRIDDRPAARERLAIPGRDTHRETCTDTPPTSAYWSYWTAAPDTCEWTYSQVGATSARVEPGTAQGWSFALGAQPGDAPPPRTGPCDAEPIARTSSREPAATHGTGSDAGGPHLDPLAALALLAAFVLGCIAAARRRRRPAPGGDHDA